jgi:hypothetical protein
MRATTTSTNFSGKLCKLAILVTVIGIGWWMTDAAMARSAAIPGTHGSSEIKGECAKSGGTYGHDTKGNYYCVNDKNKTFVWCKSGKCVGSGPDRGKPTHTLSGIIHPGGKLSNSSGGTTHPNKHHHPVNIGSHKTKATYRRSTGPTNPNGPKGGTGPYAPPNRHTSRGNAKPAMHVTEHHTDFHHSDNSKH